MGVHEPMVDVIVAICGLRYINHPNQQQPTPQQLVIFSKLYWFTLLRVVLQTNALTKCWQCIS